MIAFRAEHAANADFAENPFEICGATEGAGTIAQHTVDHAGIAERDHLPASQSVRVGGAIAPSPALQGQMDRPGVELMQVPDEGQRPGAGEIAQFPGGRFRVGGFFQTGNVGVDRALSLDHRAGGQTLGPAGPAARSDVEAPAVVAADEMAVFEFALAKQRAEMRAAALEGAPPVFRADDREVDAIASKGERSGARELRDICNTRKGCDFHETPSSTMATSAYLTAAHPRRHPVEVQTNLMVLGRRSDATG